MSAEQTQTKQKEQPKKPPAFDPVTEASDESFPASDAPAWTGHEPDADVEKEQKTR